MCGRYYIDDETAREIEKLVRLVDEKLRRERDAVVSFATGDIHPMEQAPVIVAHKGKLCCRMQRWGLPGYGKAGDNKKASVIFNARSESALDKPTFRDGVQNRRAVIPATWFYEWSRAKEKNIFRKTDGTVLFMAGCYNRYESGDCFVILTTAANESMIPIHDRMPLILERGEIEEWIFNNDQTEDFLRKKPCRLERRTDYEQLSLF